MNDYQRLNLSGATARKLTLEGMKDDFRRRRNTNCSLGRNSFEMNIPRDYQMDFVSYVMSLTGYCVVFGGPTNEVKISW